MIFHNNDCWFLSNKAQCDLTFVQFMCDALGGLAYAGSEILVPRPLTQ